MSSVYPELGAMLGAFFVVTGIADLAGAANTGTALAFGTIAFTVTLVWVLARRQ